MSFFIIDFVDLASR